MNSNEQYEYDLIGFREEHRDNLNSDAPQARISSLLEKIMENGRLLHPFPSLEESQRRFFGDFAHLPERYKALHKPSLYPVRLTPLLARFQEETVARLHARYAPSQ
jgi:hypothetical protein